MKKMLFISALLTLGTAYAQKPESEAIERDIYVPHDTVTKYGGVKIFIDGEPAVIKDTTQGGKYDSFTIIYNKDLSYHPVHVEVKVKGDKNKNQVKTKRFQTQMENFASSVTFYYCYWWEKKKKQLPDTQKK